MRKLALDIGSKRIGVAISDPTATIAKPLTTIERKPNIDDEARVLIELIEEYEVDEIIAGLPIDLRGQKAIAAQNIESYLEELEKRIKIPIKRFDERLTTKIADNMLRTAGLRSQKRKQVIDEIAAMVILQSYLESQK